MKKTILYGVVAGLFLTGCLWLPGAARAESVGNEPLAAHNAQPGQLEGGLMDSKGAAALVGKAAVFLLDAETGLPIHRETKRPMTASQSGLELEQLWTATTDDQGNFKFADVPPGTYRLVAESWSGTEGFPGVGSQRQPSSYLILHGVAENVSVQAGRPSRAWVRQLGQHVLRITNDPEEPHAFLLISLRPTLGDAILGYHGWGPEFRRHLIGATRMEVGYVTIAGLPEDAAVHVGLLNYDNNPGFGAASYQAGQSNGRLRIVASWSNGHHEPPPELEKLTDYIAAHSVQSIDWGALTNGVKSRTETLQRLFTQINENPAHTVSVPGMGEQKLVDVLAASLYAQMRATVMKRKQ